MPRLVWTKMKTYNLAKQEITQVPFQLEGTDFQPLAGWLLPQSLAFLAREMPAQKNEQGKYDAVETLKNAIAKGVGHPFDATQNKSWINGFIKYLTTSPRGSIIAGRATSAEMLPYAANVPLFLAAYKKFSNIKYSEWDVESLKWVTDDTLYQMMSSPFDREYTREELLELRDLGSTIKSGVKNGTIKNPISTTSISKTGDAVFDALPRMTKIVLCQVWVAHPSFWHDYMILDPKSWDTKPEKLIESDVVVQTVVERNPWD